MRAVQGDAHAIASCVFYFETLCCDAGLTVFPAETFDLLVTLMRDSKFLAAEHAWEILKLFENGWTLMTADQRQRLLAAVEDAYPRLQHWMGPFVLSELLGNAYCGGPALEVLERLCVTSGASARQFIPHALGHIAGNAAAQELRDQALRILQHIAATASGPIKAEATEALTKLR